MSVSSFDLWADDEESSTAPARGMWDEPEAPAGEDSATAEPKTSDVDLWAEETSDLAPAPDGGGTAPLSSTQLAEGRAATVDANAHRARVLSMVSLGELDAGQVVVDAASDTQQARWVSRIKLVKLLAAIPRWNRPRARRALQVAFPKVNVDQVNIAWLLDGRTKGRRVIGFAGLLTPRGDGPWPGFPFSDPPRMERR